MAVTVNGQIYRNLQEQVQYLTDRTNEIKPYIAGTGITISGQTIAVNPDTVQLKLTAGSGIQIDGTTISTDGSSAVSPTVNTEAIPGGTKVTITDKDGAHEFNVMNGVDGAAGKSAYASAQDGGFTGTEAQFNNGLSVMGSASGIDTTVTQNSSNLITSGAVYSYIQSLDANEVKY